MTEVNRNQVWTDGTDKYWITDDSERPVHVVNLTSGDQVAIPYRNFENGKVEKVIENVEK